MVSPLGLAFLGFGSLFAVAPVGDLDLTPLPHTSSSEAGSFPDIAFRCGTSAVVYRTPYQWQISGGRLRAVLKPDAPESEASIEIRPKPTIETFDEESVKALKKELAASIPRDAQNIQWAGDEVNTLVLNRHGTYRIQVSYSAYAQRFTTTAIYCNFAKQQLRFQLSCKDADFKKVYEAFRMSLFGFSELE